MAKAPKAPGSNGAGTPQDLINEFIARVDQMANGDSYWTCHVVARATGPIARLAGEAEARALLSRLTAMPTIVPEALGLIAEGLARRGDTAEAAATLTGAEALIEREAIDGEAGAVAWGAIARARHALGDGPAVERSLDAADACARREKSNPTQPWPHLALALADTGRLARSIALFKELGADDISFDTERAAVKAIAAALASGDRESVAALHKILAKQKLYTFVDGVRAGADAAMRAGQGAMFTRVLELMKGQSYVSNLGAALSLTAAVAGDVPLACSLAERTRDQEKHREALLADAFAALGDDAEAERILAALLSNARDPRSAAETLGPVLRLLRARGLEDYQRRVDARLAQAAALPVDEACGALGELGLALVAVGDEAQGAAHLAAALAMADAMPKTNQGWSRNRALEMLGRRYADRGRWAEGQAVLKKCSSKHGKVQIVSRLANLYARANDPIGAVMMLGYAPKGTLKTTMCACDTLYSLAGAEAPYSNYA